MVNSGLQVADLRFRQRQREVRAEGLGGRQCSNRTYCEQLFQRAHRGRGGKPVAFAGLEKGYDSVSGAVARTRSARLTFLRALYSSCA